jgi:hypothetical protein
MLAFGDGTKVVFVAGNSTGIKVTSESQWTAKVFSSRRWDSGLLATPTAQVHQGSG